MPKIQTLMAILPTVCLFLSACTSSAPDCTLAEVFCAGLVTDINEISDHGFTQSAWEGLQQARSSGIVSWIEYIESTDSRDYEKNIKTFANMGYDVILTVGAGMAESTASAAMTYPEQYFIGIDQYQTWAFDTDSSNDQDNLAGLVFPEDQAGFLAGVLAGLMTNTGKIGAVCASDDFPEMWRHGEGFRSGALYIDSELDVEVVYHTGVSATQSFNDPEWAAMVTSEMVTAGVDVIFGVGGETGKGSIIEAATLGVYAIGAESDQYLQEPVAAAKLLSSATKSITSSIVKLLQTTVKAQRGTEAFPAGNTYGEVGLAPFHELDETIPDEVKVRLEEISLMLQTGGLLTGVSPQKP